MHGGLVVALVLGAWVVAEVGPKGAYLFGGITGLVGAALLVPLLRWLPDRGADVGRVGPVEVAELIPFEPAE
jgi:hypothetical protein